MSITTIHGDCKKRLRRVTFRAMDLGPSECFFQQTHRLWEEVPSMCTGNTGLPSVTFAPAPSGDALDSASRRSLLQVYRTAG